VCRFFGRRRTRTRKRRTRVGGAPGEGGRGRVMK